MARHPHDTHRPDLDRLARDLGRQAGAERLSGDARRRLFTAVTESAEPGPLATLFLPIRRMALAAVLPALVLGVMLVGVSSHRPDPVDAGATRVSAEKVGDEVVFRIANGGQAHRVVRSDVPGRLVGDGSGQVSVRGEFRDRLAGGSSLVFYRID